MRKIHIRDAGRSTHLHLAGIHWYQSEHVFCYPKDLPTAERLACLSSSELSAWRKPHAYKFRRFREQAKEHGWNIPNGPKGTRMICEELLRRKNAVEEGFRQIAAMRRTIADDCQMELNVRGSIGYDLFTDQFSRRSSVNHEMAQGITRANYFASTILGCDLGGLMDHLPEPSAAQIEKESRGLAKNEPHPKTLRGNILRDMMITSGHISTAFFAQKNGKLLPGQVFQWGMFMYRRPPLRGRYSVTVDYRTLRDFCSRPASAPRKPSSLLLPPLWRPPMRGRPGGRASVPTWNFNSRRPRPLFPTSRRAKAIGIYWIQEITSSAQSSWLRRKRKDAAESRRPLFSEPPAPDAPARARPRGNPAS